MSARSYDINKLNKKQSNIYVKLENNVKSVLLHNNEVIKIVDDRFIFLSSCGWHTRTTMTAINRGLEQLNMPLKVYSKKGKLYLYNYLLKYDLEFIDNMRITF